MRTADAISYYGSKSAIARNLGISTAALAKWREVVPFGSALRLAELSGHKLTVDRKLYDERLRPLKNEAA